MLLSPLDWGLGHTSRCIPIIQELIQLNCNVWIACNTKQKALLEQEFPSLTYINLQGYNQKYAKKRWLTLARIVFSLPMILIKVKRENRWLRSFLEQHPVSAVISDNRFGLYSGKVPTVFITHQLGVKTGLGKWIGRVTQSWNYHYIEKFSCCWVPDYKGEKAIAGDLSNPSRLPGIPVHFAGILSRFQPCPAPAKNGNVLIIISGPEPQRTIFENIILRDLQSHPGKVVLVRGLPGTTETIQVPAGVTVYNHANAITLNKLICDAEIIISRSGYTTVMDIFKLRRKYIMVPTPGQPEQEFLGVYLHAKQLAYSVSQPSFSLSKELTAVNSFSFRFINDSMEDYKFVVRDFVKSLNTTH